MSNPLHVADISPAKTPTARRPGIPPPPLPSDSTIATRHIIDGTSTIDDNDIIKRTSQGGPTQPPPPPRRTSSIPSFRDSDPADTSNDLGHWNGHVVFDVLSFVVHELRGTMLSLEYRDPVEHGSEVKDIQSGTVYQRKPNGVYFRLTSVGVRKDQLHVGDEVLAVAGYQLADMSLETARMLLDDQDDKKGVSITVARQRDHHADTATEVLTVSALSTLSEEMPKDHTNYVGSNSEVPLRAPPRRKKSIRSTEKSERSSEQFDVDRSSRDGDTIGQNDKPLEKPLSMTTVIRIDSNGNIELNQTHYDNNVNDEEPLLVSDDAGHQGPTSHNVPDNLSSNKFRVTIKCDDDDDLVTSQTDEFSSDHTSRTVPTSDTVAKQMSRDEPFNYTTTSSELIDDDVTRPPVRSDDMLPPPLPSSMPPTIAAMTTSTSLRPHTLSLQPGSQTDAIPSPLAVVLPPPSPYAASPIDQLNRTTMVESPSKTVPPSGRIHVDSNADTIVNSSSETNPPPGRKHVDELHSTTILDSPSKTRPPPGRIHVDLNEDEQELIRRAFRDDHFGGAASAVTVVKTILTSSETISPKASIPSSSSSFSSSTSTTTTTAAAAAAASSSESTENKQTSDPLTSSYLSLISSHGYSNRRQVATAVRSLINKSSFLSSTSNVGSSNSIDGDGNHHSNKVNDVESDEVRSGLNDLRTPGGQSTNYLLTRDISAQNTENLANIKATHVVEPVSWTTANNGLDDLQTRLTSDGIRSSKTSQDVGGTARDVCLDDDVTIRKIAQDLVVTKAIKEAQNDTKLCLDSDVTNDTKRVGDFVTSLPDATETEVEMKNRVKFDSENGFGKHVQRCTNDVMTTEKPREDSYVTSLTTSLSPLSDVISTSVGSENEVFDGQLAVTSPPTPPTPDSSQAFSKSRLSVQSDQAVCDILKDYYSPSNKDVEDACSTKKTPAKPIISKALLPRSLRSSQSSQMISVSTSGVDYAVPLCLLKGAQGQGQPMATNDKSSAKELLPASSSEKILSKEDNRQWPIGPIQNTGTPVMLKYDSVVQPDVTEPAKEFSSQDTSSDDVGITVDDLRAEVAVPDTARLEIASSRAFFKSLITDTKLRSSDSQRADGQLLNQNHRTPSLTSSESNDSSFVEHVDIQLNNDQNIKSNGTGSVQLVELVSESVNNDLQRSEDTASKTSLEANDEVPKMADSKAFFESIQKNKSEKTANNRSRAIGRSASATSTSKALAPTKRLPVSELPKLANDVTAELPSMADSKAFFENLRKQQQNPPQVSAKPKVAVRTGSVSSQSNGEAALQPSTTENKSSSTSNSRPTSQVDLGDEELSTGGQAANVGSLNRNSDEQDGLLSGGPVSKVDAPVVRSSADLSTGGTVAKLDTRVTRTSWTSLQWKPTLSKTITETSSNGVSEPPEMTSSVTGTKELFESKSTTPQMSPAVKPVKPVKRGVSMSAADTGTRVSIRTGVSSSTQSAPTNEVTISTADVPTNDDSRLTTTAAREKSSLIPDKKPPKSLQHRPSLTSTASPQAGDMKSKVWRQFMSDYGKQ